MDTLQQEQLKILVIGDSCTDIYHYGDCLRISQDAPVPVLRHVNSEIFGGMARNVYKNLVGLGSSVDIITNHEKITKERFIDKRTMHHLLRFDTGESQRLCTISEEKINSIIFSNYSAVIISDYDKGFLDSESIKKILLKRKDLDVPIFVDSKKKDLSCFENCIIKINEIEYDESIFLPSTYELIVTAGRKGAMWRGELFPAIKSEIDDLETSSSNSLIVANVCCAGDTFLCGLITEYLKSGDMKKSIKFANLCGSRAIENFGTYVISLDDLR